MSNEDIVREAFPVWPDYAIAALDALVAERDEAREAAQARWEVSLAAQKELEVRVGYLVAEAHGWQPQLEAAKAERDDFKRSYMEQRGMREESDMRLVETMAEVARLREALTEIRDMHGARDYSSRSGVMADTAHAALTKKEA